LTDPETVGCAPEASCLGDGKQCLGQEKTVEIHPFDA
jgi:hypothetical protein